MSSGIEFFELPQGSPSINPVSTGTGYCTASDVVSLAPAITLGSGNNPTLSMVNGYILMVSGQIDAVLSRNGYSVPVNTASVPEAQGLLCWVNATGAAALLQEAAPVAPNVDRAKAAFDSAMEMLESAKFAIGVPSDETRAKPRAPWISFQPPRGVYDPQLEAIGGQPGDGISGGAGVANRRSLPYFNRAQRF